MNKYDITIKELKDDINELEKEFKKRTKGLDKETIEAARTFVDRTEKVIEAVIDKTGAVIKEFKDDEQLEELLDKLRARAQEAIDYALDKIDTVINSGPETEIDRLYNDIANEFDSLKDTEIYKTTSVLIKQGYEKINEFLDKPEVQDTISKAKKTTINLAEKGVAGLKKVLENETITKPKKTTKKKATKKVTPKKATATKKKTTKTVKAKTTKKKAA